jgi:hypothetical protein
MTATTVVNATVVNATVVNVTVVNVTVVNVTVVNVTVVRGPREAVASSAASLRTRTALRPLR